MGRAGRFWEPQQFRGWRGMLSKPQGGWSRHGGGRVVLENLPLIPSRAYTSWLLESGSNPALPLPWVTMHRTPGVFWRSCPHLIV